MALAIQLFMPSGVSVRPRIFGERRVEAPIKPQPREIGFCAVMLSNITFYTPEAVLRERVSNFSFKTVRATAPGAFDGNFRPPAFFHLNFKRHAG